MHIIYKYAFVVSLDLFFFKSMINIDTYLIVKYGINLGKTFVKKKMANYLLTLNISSVHIVHNDLNTCFNISILELQMIRLKFKLC